MKECILEGVANLECDVEMIKDDLKQSADKNESSPLHGLIIKDELKQLTEKHTTLLLEDLSLIKQSKMREIYMETDAIDAYMEFRNIPFLLQDSNG